MSFEKPPSLDENFNAVPAVIKDTTLRQKRVRRLTISLIILVFILLMANLWQSDISANLRGMGAVRGVAIDVNGQPFAGRIFVEGTNLIANTNVDGSFEVKNIPAGQRLIVVADSLSGREYPVQINAGQVTDVGNVVFKSTATP